MKMLDMLFPRNCPFCGGELPERKLVCEACRDSLERFQPDICPACGKARKNCACKNIFYDGLCAPYGYAGPVATGVKGLKFHEKMEGLPFFAAQMVAYARMAFGGVHFDVVVPVPLSQKRLLKRGYNQAELLAYELADSMGLVLDEALLRKILHNSPQSLRRRGERATNVAGAYAVHPRAELSGRTVLLVDDVCTTGATLNECAKMLKFSGAKAVFCVVLAKTGHTISRFDGAVFGTPAAAGVEKGQK